VGKELKANPRLEIETLTDRR